MHTSDQTISARHDDLNSIREHLSLESFHKLNRACETLHYFGSDLRRHEINGLSQLYTPQILSYVHEDISHVLEELKAKGLCRDFVAPATVSGGEHHV
ncbi:Derepression protein [Enterobacter kobei]|uniref:Derepression protein n=1 Tax=Enterobacter kobei TaxID=208224 RepID=UPI002004C9B9|nr:Derepression protein [Enterobacter kobei]MCK6999610.1 Derepression protein [Enterobacter kobei]URL26510.1 Derepression protein [Enterobacter kobei]